MPRSLTRPQDREDEVQRHMERTCEYGARVRKFVAGYADKLGAFTKDVQ